MKAIRLGFTGMGHIPVHAHLPGLAPLVESGEVVLQAFCDLNVEAAQEQAKASAEGGGRVLDLQDFASGN